jgi:hypothetical protein
MLEFPHCSKSLTNFGYPSGSLAACAEELFAVRKMPVMAIATQRWSRFFAPRSLQLRLLLDEVSSLWSETLR